MWPPKHPTAVLDVSVPVDYVECAACGCRMVGGTFRSQLIRIVAHAEDPRVACDGRVVDYSKATLKLYA